jgi:hypothetical protein
MGICHGGHWFGLLIGIVVAAGCTSSDEDAQASNELCTQLRSHIIEVRLTGMSDVDIEAHRAAFERSLGDDFVTACEKTYSIRQVKCALATPESDAVEACTHAAVAAAP